MKPYLKRAWAEISLGTLESNIEKIKSILSDNTQIMAVIKADAYGHGEDDILKKLCECGIKYFAVSNLDEALSVRKHCPDGEKYVRRKLHFLCIAYNSVTPIFLLFLPLQYHEDLFPVLIN